MATRLAASGGRQVYFRARFFAGHIGPVGRSLQLLKSLVARSSGRHRIDGDSFIKCGVQQPLLESEKSAALYRVALASGFLAAEVLGHDSRAGTVTFKVIPGLRSIRTIYLSYMTDRYPRPPMLDVIRDAGRSLAQIHAGLTLRSTASWKPSPCFAAAFSSVHGQPAEASLDAGPQAVLHGDYGFSNVNVVDQPAGMTIAVIDASANGFVTLRSDLRGPVYIDVGNFVSCIEGLVPLRHYPRMHWGRLPIVREAFLSGYESAGTRIDRRLLASTVYATAACYIQRKFGSGRLAAAALRVLFNARKDNTVPGRLHG